MHPYPIAFVRFILLAVFIVACGGGGGSSGSSTVNPTGSTSNGALPDLRVTAFTAPTAANAGDTKQVTVTVTNQGGMTQYGVAVVIYLSTLPQLSIEDGFVGLDVNLVWLDVGQSVTRTFDINFPSNIATGSYTIGAYASSPSDTTFSADRFMTRAIAVTGTTCTPDNYEADNDAATARDLSFGIPQTHNHCEGTRDWMRFSAAGGQTYTFSAGKIGSEAFPMLRIYGTDGATLLATANYSVDIWAPRMTWTAPASGTYYLRAEPIGGVASSGANTEYDVAWGDSRPDLISSSIYIGTNTLYPGGVVWISDTAYNQGFSDAGAFTVAAYLSTDANITTGDTLIGTRSVSGLKVGESNYSQSTAYSLPSNLTPGQTYYVGTIVNYNGAPNSEYAMGNNASKPIAITIAAPPNCSDDGFEEDDTAALAKTIVVGDPAQNHTQCLDGEDWVKFSAVANSQYAVRVAGVGLTVKLYNDTVLADANVTPLFTANNAIDFTASATGTYYVRISGAPGAGHDYTVKVDPFLPDLTTSVNTTTTNSVVAGGYLQIHDLTSNIGVGPAGAFSIDAYLSTDTNVTTGDLLMGSRSVTGLNASAANEQWYYIHVPKTLAAGTYSLATIADAANQQAELSETNNTSAPVSVTVTNCAVDAYEDDDSYTDAKPIALNENQSRNFCDEGVDWAQFTPANNGVYLVTGKTVTVYGSDGATPIVPQDRYVYDQLSFNGTAGVRYYIKNTTLGSGTEMNSGGGAYTLTVQQCTQDAYEDDDTPATAKAIALGQTQSHNLCDDNADWMTFSAVAGQSYSVTASNVGSAAHAAVDIYDTAGQSPLVSGQSAQGGKSNKISGWVAPSTATYYIRVHQFPGAWGQNTDYSITVN